MQYCDSHITNTAEAAVLQQQDKRCLFLYIMQALFIDDKATLVH